MKIAMELSEKEMNRARKTAKHFHVKVEELLRAGVADFLSQPDDEFDRAARYILKKNRELYRRLA